MSGALVPPAGDAVAAALRRVAGPAEAVRGWVPLPAAPEGWTWRAGALERVVGARRWTIGRRAAWDARWQLLLWRDGRAYLVRQGEADAVGEWAALVVVAETFEEMGEGWRATIGAGEGVAALVRYAGGGAG